MRVLKGKKQGFYKVESTSKKGKFYEVDIKKPFCTCPDFMFRELKRHGVCKHIKEIREFAEKKGSKIADKIDAKSKKAIDFIKKSKSSGSEGVDAVKLSEKFGEDTINELKRRGEITEKGGRIRIL